MQKYQEFCFQKSSENILLCPQNTLSLQKSRRAMQESMIKVSEAAFEHVNSLREEQGYDESYGLRVSVEGGGCSGLMYKLDFDNQEQTGDQVIEDKGIKIFVNIKSLLYLVGTELDYSGGLHGKGFHFSNPNASRTCACGESFSV